MLTDSFIILELMPIETGNIMSQIKTTNIQRSHSDFVKPSELIDIHEISPLTLNDRRIFNELIANAWESIEEDKEHVISKMSLKGSMKGNERIEDTIKKLMSAIVETKMTINGQPATERIQLLGYNKSMSNNNGLLYYRFPDELRRLIANSNVWAKIERDVMFAFTSKYSLSLYEMVQKRRNLRMQREKFSVEEIRNLLGVPKNKLKLFGDLNKYAFKKAVEEVNALSDMEVRLVPLKRGRQVTDIEMWWFQKELPWAKESYAELQKHKTGRKARLNGTVETPVLSKIIGNNN